MEIREMQIEDIELRLSEIRGAMDAPEADLDALSKELDEIEARKSELVALAEERKALSEKIAKADEIKVVERFEEEIKMEEKRTFAVDTVEYREAWLKNLQGKELSAEERTAVVAQSAIPTETMNKIVSRLDLAPLLKAVDLTYIPGNITYPVEDTVNAANWVDMATAATDSADVLGSITLNAYKLIKTVEITADVAAMAVSAFENWLVERLANKIEFAIDSAIIAGTGVNQATGILTSAAGSSTKIKKGTWTKTGMTYKDMMTILATLPTKYMSGAVFVMPRATFYGEVLGLEDSTGNRVVVADAQSPAKFNILGFPVIVDDNCSADTVIFGDFKEYKFNFAKAPEVSSDSSVAFRSGSIIYRSLALCDGKVADENAFAVYTKAV